MGRSILVIGLLGFLVGMGVFGASEIAQGRALAARIVQMLPSRAAIEDLLQLAQSAHAPVEEADEEAAAPPSHAPATPTPRLVATPTSGRPTPGPSAEKVKIPENAAGR